MTTRLRVKELASARKISLSRLSRLSDVSYKTVQGMWRYPERGFNTKTLERIARTLDVPLSELFEEIPDS